MWRVALVAVTAVVFVACGDERGSEQGEPTTSTTARPKASSPTDSTRKSGGGIGDEVSADGAVLEPPVDADTRQIDAEAACRTFLNTAGGTCEIVPMAGGNALWTVDAGPELGTGEREYRVQVRVRSTMLPDGGWDVALSTAAARPRYADVTVVPADVTGDGEFELIVLYRSGGTSQLEAYDVITYELGGSVGVAAHRGPLHKGSVALEGTTIVDYSADEESPECCPTRSLRTVIAFREGAFRVLEQTEVPIDQQPPDIAS
jgi:hypothetical protein